MKKFPLMFAAALLSGVLVVSQPLPEDKPWSIEECSWKANRLRPWLAGDAVIKCADHRLPPLNGYGGTTVGVPNNTSADKTILIAQENAKFALEFLLWHEAGHVWLQSHERSASLLHAKFGRKLDEGEYFHQPQEIFAQSVAICYLGKPWFEEQFPYPELPCSEVQEVIRAGQNFPFEIGGNR